MSRRAEMLRTGEFEDGMCYLRLPKCSEWEYLKTACAISASRDAPNGRNADGICYSREPKCSAWKNLKTACAISDSRNAPNGRIWRRHVLSRIAGMLRTGEFEDGMCGGSATGCALAEKNEPVTDARPPMRRGANTSTGGASDTREYRPGRAVTHAVLASATHMNVRRLQVTDKHVNESRHPSEWSLLEHQYEVWCQVRPNH